MTEPTAPRPLKRTIPPDLQRQVEDIQIKVPRTTGPPGDLDEEKKRWLIVGICLHSIISPLLRKYVDPILRNLFSSLVASDFIDTQGYYRYLKKYPATNRYYLNYESINNNRSVPKKKISNKWINDYQAYDYKVTSNVDLSKLFLQPSMAQYSAIDESCDLSALLGMVINISSFQPAVQFDAKKIRSDIRNPWAHCDFTEWTAIKYTDAFQLMGQLVKNFGLINREENKILGELNNWATNGQNFLSGTVLGLEIVNDIHQQTQILSEYVLTLCTEADSQFIKVQQELNDLENRLQERIGNLESKTKEHDEELNNLKEEMKKQVEDHIPKHIRAQHRQEISEWEQDETTFIKTRATHHILESMHLNNCIVVTGSSGCGKSANIHHAALSLSDEFQYEIIPVLTGPTDIINYYNKNKRQVFVVDDICGKETINRQTLLMWRDYSEKMEKLFKTVANEKEKIIIDNLKVSDPKLLISCRLHIYKESQFQQLKLFTKEECNLQSSGLCLLQNERMLMLQKYLPSYILEQVIPVMETVDFFPLLCKLSKNKTSEETIKLFTAPLVSIRENIKYIISDNKAQFCALVLCILFDDGFDTDWLKLKSAPETKKVKLVNIVQEFEIDINKEMSRSTLKSGFTTLEGTFIKRRGTYYRMIHDKITQMSAVICGQNLTESFINYAPSIFIRDNFTFEFEENDGLIFLSEDQENEYFNRLLRDLKDFDITSTFHNQQLISQSFIDRLISFFKMSDEAMALLKELDTKGCELIVGDYYRPFSTTPLIESASGGYFNIVHFLIATVHCNVNKVDGRGKTSLYKTSEEGKTDIVNLLLQNNADVSYRNIIGESALYVACKRGNTDTVNVLLQNNADTAKCNITGESPLYVACKGGYIAIVKLLIHNNADVNQCNLNRETPLYVACKEGYTDTVKLLLKNHVDVSQCNRHGKSPLFVACEGGHSDIMTLLLHNKADIFQCNRNGESSLFVACKRGNIDTVKRLLQSNAVVSQCNIIGESPLFVACKRGHTDLVRLLLKNNADVYQCNSRGKSPLYVACEVGHSDIVELLLQNNVDIKRCDEKENSLVHVACKGGHTYIVELLLQNITDVCQLNKYCDSLLFVAIEGGHTDIVKLLLQNNVNISQRNKSGKSPLLLACEGGHTDLVEFLLEKNADVSQCNSNGESLLYVACKRQHKDIVELLLQSNADVSHCNISGEFPLFLACIMGHTGIFKLLIQNNADVSQCNSNGESLLYVACEKRHKDIVDFLLKNNADFSLCSKTGESPMDVACRRGHTDIVELFLQNNANVSQCNKYGESPLYMACEGGHKDTVQLLLQNNANVSQCNTYGESPLYVACKRGHTHLVELFLQNNADVSQCNTNGESQLYMACKGGYKDTVELLLQNNANVSQCNKTGWSPLYVACIGGHKDTVELLLQNNADVSQCNTNGESPLFVACKGGHKDTVELLLQNNADVSQCNTNGESPLYVACQRGHKDTVELLLQNNADVSQCNTNGECPLYTACKEGHKETVELLLQNNADVSQCNTNGECPLYTACKEGHEETVELLLQNNADVSQCNTNGESPLYVACKGGHKDTVELLLQNNADVSQCEITGNSPLHAVFDVFRRVRSTFISTRRLYLNCTIIIIKLLLAWNADVRICNNSGQTPLDIARELECTELVHLLETNIN